jgi:hypothetical protein
MSMTASTGFRYRSQRSLDVGDNRTFGSGRRIVQAVTNFDRPRHSNGG